MADNSKIGILLFGAGMCSGPAIDYWAQAGYKLTVANRTLKKAETQIEGLGSNVRAVEIDVTPDNDAWKEKAAGEVKEHDMVISLLPWTHHHLIAEVALELGKHFCTTSYVSDSMKALAEKYKETIEEKNIVMLNECGVDPGLDHMSAMKIIDKCKSEGGRVVSFRSLCGGLPSPQFNNNPWGYKCSWSPRGILLASSQPAAFLKNGLKKSIPANGDLFKPIIGYHTEKMEASVAGKSGYLDWYPNRDSTNYVDIYGFAGIENCVRGTYRNAGFCDALTELVQMGFTKADKMNFKGATLGEFTLQVLGVDDSSADPKETLKKLHPQATADLVAKMDYLGLFDKKAKLPAKCYSPLDVMSAQMLARLVFADNETDMICMKHSFELEDKDGQRSNVISCLYDHGLQYLKKANGKVEESSMARTVALPLAVGVDAILHGKFKGVRGIVRPVIPLIYNYILEEMEKFNIKFVEKQFKAHLWIRHEVKKGERRVILVPKDCKTLIDAGYYISVERSSTRCIPDVEFEKVGCEMVDSETWMYAPDETYILGLKELPESSMPLKHRHIYFAHCYKGQAGWAELLNLFNRGGGSLLDLEFLVEKCKDGITRRVAAFGRAAGQAGAAVGLLQWAARQNKDASVIGPLDFWSSKEKMVTYVREQLAEAFKVCGKKPTAHVLGAKGRCGGGAVDILKQCGVQTIVEWDMAETNGKSTPFPELLQQDVLVNCIFLPPGQNFGQYLTMDMVKNQKPETDNLSVFVDVSCDATNPYNPFPLYSRATTLDDPIERVFFDKGQEGDYLKSIDVCSIDHLPSLVPLESSQDFSADLMKANVMPDLVNMKNDVFQGARDLFKAKLADAAGQKK